MSSNNNQSKNKPANTLFKQQRLASWQPIMSPPHVTACFICVAAIFIPIGAAILTANGSTVDVEVRYDQLKKCTAASNEGINTVSYDDNGTTVTQSQGCRTYVTLDIPSNLEPPIYMYYGLRNFYQNHRSYAKSRNEKQLAGDLITTEGDLFDARPFRRPGENFLSAQYGSAQPIEVNLGKGAAGSALFSSNYGGMVYSPAGLVPWSLFNDTFRLFYINKSTTTNTYELVCDTSLFKKNDNTPVQPADYTLGKSGTNRTLFGWNSACTDPNTCEWNMTCYKEGIAWNSDKEVKFKTPALADNIWTALRTEYIPAGADQSAVGFNDTYRPTSSDPFYENGWYAGEAGHNVPVTTDEDLMVWMRTSALPEFRKLFRIISVPIPAGEYLVEIDEMFDVSSFEGEKYVALATVSWIGGKNGFLGLAYIIVGSIAFLAGVVFFLVYKCTGDRTQRAIDTLNELQ